VIDPVARGLDLALLRAWPPQHEQRIGRWLARFDGGVTRRANSVLPLGKGRAPNSTTLDGWLDEVIALYRERALTPCVQLTSASWPPDLEGQLLARGWSVGITPTVVMAGPLVAIETMSVTSSAAPSETWLDTWWQVDGRGDTTALATIVSLLGRIEGPKAFLRVEEGTRTVGTCLAVMVARSLVLSCAATLPNERRRGVASSAMAAAWRWASTLGAERAVLAVQADNRPAVALYERLGLQTAGGYSYAEAD
jgi:N-acetylglutamate synthase